MSNLSRTYCRTISYLIRICLIRLGIRFQNIQNYFYCPRKKSCRSLAPFSIYIFLKKSLTFFPYNTKHFDHNSHSFHRIYVSERTPRRR